MAGLLARARSKGNSGLNGRRGLEGLMAGLAGGGRRRRKVATRLNISRSRGSGKRAQSRAIIAAVLVTAVLGLVGYTAFSGGPKHIILDTAANFAGGAAQVLNRSTASDDAAKAASIGDDAPPAGGIDAEAEHAPIDGGVQPVIADQPEGDLAAAEHAGDMDFVAVDEGAEAHDDTGTQDMAASEGGQGADGDNFVAVDADADARPPVDDSWQSTVDHGTIRDCLVTPRFERVCVYGPLCIDDGQMVHISPHATCQRMRPKGEVTPVEGEECLKFEKSMMREADFKHDPVEQSEEWLREKVSRGEVNWVEGETALMGFGSSAGNIAHYAGRVLFLTNLRRHPKVYGATSVDNLVFMVHDSIAAQFLSDASWHRGILRAVAYPLPLPDKIHEDLDALSGRDASGVQFVMTKSGALPTGRTTCFRKALLPAFLKGRYFVPNFEIPGLPSYPSEADPEALPGDALKLRRDLVAAMGTQAADDATRLRKRIVHLKRQQRRAFEPTTEASLEAELGSFAENAGYEFQSVLFDGLSFGDQVRAVQGAAIAVGIHGANLVNTMFMPPGSFLIEIFPFGFDHDMYRFGCGSGLQYRRLELTTGAEFEELSTYKDRRECMSKSNACKVHYRGDNQMLEISQEDMEALLRILEEAKQAVAADVVR